MSALRVSRPGLPVLLIDQGPAVARYHGASGPLRVIGGSTQLVSDVSRASLRTPEPEKDRARRKAREAR